MWRGSPLFRSLCLLSLAVAWGCDYAHDSDLAVVDVKPTSANGPYVHGTLEFEETSEGVRVFGSISGLSPGDHGMHLHVYGTCEDVYLSVDRDTVVDPAGAAGPHFDPLETMNHAGPDTPFTERHAGDMGNITANVHGIASVDAEYEGLMIGGRFSIVGRSLIVHAEPDDFTSQPDGGSGTRVGCGIVRTH